MGLTIAPDLDSLAKADSSPRREINLLLACLKASLDPACVADLRRETERTIDWGQLLWLAYRHGMLVALSNGLRSANAAIPMDLDAQLAQYADLNQDRARRYRQEAERLTTMLSGEGIEPLAFRGLTLELTASGDREIDALDLVIASNAEKAERLLLADGYRFFHPILPRQAGALRRAHGASTLHHDDRHIRLQLWDRTAPDAFAIGPAIAAMRRRSRRVGGLLTLSPEDLLLEACIHGSLHLWGRLALIADVARILQVDQLDWKRALQIAGDTDAQRTLLLGVQVAIDLLGAVVPPEISGRIDSDPEIRKLAHFVREHLFHDLRGRHTELERARFRLAALRTPTHCARYALLFATLPDVEDFHAVDLPAPLSPLYRVLRPARLGSLMAGRALGRRMRAPYVPSPLPVVQHMLRMAEITSDDVVYDLGCGDGRILIEAAGTYGVRCVGVDLDREILGKARENAKAAGVDHLVSFVEADALDVDLSPASVVTLWTVPDLNLQLRPRLLQGMAPGARVVGHSFDMGDWIPTKTELISNGPDALVAYLWTIPVR